MITVREKIKTTQAELDSVNQNNRMRISQQVYKDSKHRGKRCQLNPDGSFEEFVEESFQ